MFITLDMCYCKLPCTSVPSYQPIQSNNASFYPNYCLAVLFPGIIRILSKIKIKRLANCLEQCHSKLISMLQCYLRFLVIYNTVVLFIFSLNLILVTIANPSITNPGSSTNNRPLTAVLYNNIQGFINFKSLKIFPL